MIFNLIVMMLTKNINIIIILVFLLAVSSCSNPKIILPQGNLGKRINSDANEIAPFIVGDTLYFTSDRETKIDRNTPKRSNKGPSGSIQDQDDRQRSPSNFNIWKSPLKSNSMPALNEEFNSEMNNTGCLAFTDTVNKTSGYFAVACPLSEVYSIKVNRPYIGEVGGSDIIEFTNYENGKRNVNVIDSIVNSSSWDGHPTSIQIGDSLLLIFSSDRKSEHGAGYSRPYNNTDLFYSFRFNEQWDEAKNLNTASGEKINADSNQYSPFIYRCKHCPDTYLLFYSSNCNKCDPLNRYGYDIMVARLKIDFSKKLINVEKIDILPKGDDSINSYADDKYPFVYDRGDSVFIYLSSDRDIEKRKVDKNNAIQNVGNYDLYRFPFNPDEYCNCKTPPHPICFPNFPNCIVRDSVPCFQTGYWEVNSTENLHEFLKDLESGSSVLGNKNMSFIELNPYNARYRDKRGKQLKSATTEKYEQYARNIVDPSIKRIVHTIVEKIEEFERFRDEAAGIDADFRLHIEMTAYSDARDILSGFYVGDQVKFYSVVKNMYLNNEELIGSPGELSNTTENRNFDVKKVMIENHDKIDKMNDTLSKLRAFYGYQAIMSSLNSENPELFSNNQIFLPAPVVRDSRIILNSSVVFTGKNSDEDRANFDGEVMNFPIIITLKHDVDYTPVARSDDYDFIRRIEVKIELLEAKDGLLYPASKNWCCRPSLKKNKRMLPKMPK